MRHVPSTPIVAIAGCLLFVVSTREPPPPAPADVTVHAQGNADLAGTWTIERGAAPAGRGAGGISGIPIASLLVIKVTPDDVTVESDTGSGQTMQTFVYKLDGSTNPIPGALGWETNAKASWEGGALVVMTRRSMQGPTGTMGVEVKDVYSVGGDVLTIERSLGRATQKLVYKKGAPR
jgi:hypothetical protein